MKTDLPERTKSANCRFRTERLSGRITIGKQALQCYRNLLADTGYRKGYGKRYLTYGKRYLTPLTP